MVQVNDNLKASGILSTTVPALLTTDGRTLTSTRTISVEMASIVNLAAVLGGENDQEVSQIEKYFDLF